LEGKIQKQKKQDAQLMVDKYGMGETLYRDKEGCKGNSSEQPQNNKQQESKLKVLNPAKQQRLNQGKVQ
jgi:hypothetical protein